MHYFKVLSGFQQIDEGGGGHGGVGVGPDGRPSRTSASSLGGGGGAGGVGGRVSQVGGGGAMGHDSGESGDDASNYPYPYEENSQIVYQGYLYKQVRTYIVFRRTFTTCARNFSISIKN